MIDIRGLTHTYGEGTPFCRTAVDHVDLAIEAGEMVGVIGHTGSGKSTLIQHLNGLLKPTEGEIYIDGKKMWEKENPIRDFRFMVGLVFQYPEYQLFEETVYKDIAFGPQNMGMKGEELDRAVRRAAELVGLSTAQLDMSPFELSGGQKRRVAIAGVIAMEPKVLILDEPTAGLDPHGRDIILNMIRTYHEKTGSTVLLVSHSMEDVARFADKVLVMNEGKVEMYGTTHEVFAHAERLQEIGLNVPQVTRIFAALRARGVDVPADVTTVTEGRDAILRALGKEVG